MVKKNLMDIVTLSGIRKELLIYIYNDPRSLSEIRNYFDVSTPEVSPRIKELIEHDLIKFEGKKYYITAMGKTIVKNFLPFIDTINVFSLYRDWWKEHDVSSIPEEMLFRIGEISNFFIIEDDMDNAERTKVELSSILYNSKKVFGVTCVFYNNFPELFLNVAKKNIPMHLVITDKIFNMIENKYRKELNEFSNINNSSIYISKENFNISHIVTDNCLYLSLSYKNGKLDLQSNLVSNDPKSIKWGIDLYEYYRNRSQKMVLQ